MYLFFLWLVERMLTKILSVFKIHHRENVRLSREESKSGRKSEGAFFYRTVAVFSFKFEFYPICDVKFSFPDPGVRKAPDPVSRTDQQNSTLQSHDTWHFLEQLIDFASCCSARCPRCACQDRWRRRPYSSRVSLSTLSTPFSPPSMWVPWFTISLKEMYSCSKKFKKKPRPLLRPKTNHIICHQNPNPSAWDSPFDVFLKG